MRIGYFVNQYPAATHTFIRREIRGMEALGVSTFRYALRSSKYKSGDAEDELEERLTKHIFGAGLREIMRCCLAALLAQPAAWGRAILEAVRIGWRSDRGILRHLIYVVDAAVLASWCRRDGVEHVHAHFGTNSAAIAMLARHFSGIPYSFTAHGADEFEKAQLLSLDIKLERAAFAVCVSSFGRSQLMRWSRPDQWSKIEVVHCGVDRLFLESSAQRPPTAPRLVCVGRLDAWKGQLVLVGAVRRLREAGVPCEIVLVGDGPFRKHVEDAISDAGLQSAITILGWASGDQVKQEIMAARALVQPSFYEGLPVVIMEAMALGRPVISTYVGGIPELVENNKTGWLAPAGDEIALSEAMRTALEASVDQLAAMGAAGRGRVIESHDSMKEAGKLLRLIQKTEERSGCATEIDGWRVRPFAAGSEFALRRMVCAWDDSEAAAIRVKHRLIEPRVRKLNRSSQTTRSSTAFDP
jgi:colanic acid/amylovoran biosynthesis glycosyltransferase